MKVVRLSRGKPKKPRSNARSLAEEAFADAWATTSHNLLTEFAWREYRFHPERRWKFDFAWPLFRVALEIEGLGRHQKIEGYANDCEKYSEAAILGWRIIRVMARDKGKVGEWVQLVKRALAYTTRRSSAGYSIER